MGRKKNDKYWIQKAIKKPGALRQYVKRIYGEEGFTRRGTIKVSVLRELAENARNPTIRKRAQLALTLRKLKK